MFINGTHLFPAFVEWSVLSAVGLFTVRKLYEICCQGGRLSDEPFAQSSVQSIQSHNTDTGTYTPRTHTHTTFYIWSE